VAHSSVGCNIGECGWVFIWSTQVMKIFGAILVILVGYLNGPLKWLTFLV
jgi:hypothetical protein